MQHRPVVLPSHELAQLLVQRQTAFSSLYWRRRIRNDEHYSLVSRAKVPLDYRLLYDSWLWRHVFHAAFALLPISRIAELLPGKSLTIPVALQSASYRGALDRVDEIKPPPLPKALAIREKRIKCCLSALNVRRYDAIVGNHIIDDLLFGLEFPDYEQRQHTYLDPQLSKRAWKNMSSTKSLAKHVATLTDLFSGLVRQMKSPSLLILRHYPSTFALKTGDRIRSSAEMEAYHALIECLRTLAGVQVECWDGICTNVAVGSLYPNSVFVVKKKPCAARNPRASRSKN